LDAFSSDRDDKSEHEVVVRLVEISSADEGRCHRTEDFQRTSNKVLILAIPNLKFQRVPYLG
jgi:hypothetical protein